MENELENLKAGLEKLDWESILENLNTRGYALVSDVLPVAMAEAFKDSYSSISGYRKIVNMERYRFGKGEYKYFDYPLPENLVLIREFLYKQLSPLANAWMKNLKMDILYPEQYSDFIRECRNSGQNLSTPLILKYGAGGYNTLHQDLYGKVYFPIQAVFFLNEPGKDYGGGELVLTLNIPRAQSQVKVIQAKKGDLLLFTTQFKPMQGKKGYYRMAMKHGVSELIWGERHTLGIIFHDALN